jgi:hypothetical protein
MGDAKKEPFLKKSKNPKPKILGKQNSKQPPLKKKDGNFPRKKRISCRCKSLQVMVGLVIAKMQH